MKFIASRDLRIRPGSVWNLLRQEKDLIVTSNGKPVGILTAVDESTLEDILATLRQARAQGAIGALRRIAVDRGLDQMTGERVQDIVTKARRSSRARVSASSRR